MTEDVDRRMGVSGFARLIGDWRPADGRGVGIALAERVRLLVLDGRLPQQVRLPAERDLAATLGISRTTVAGAYRRLRDTGLLDSRRGAGSWTRLPASAGTPGWAAPFFPDEGQQTSVLDLAHAAGPAPGEPLRVALADATGDLEAFLGGHGYSAVGVAALRAAVAERYTARGLPTTADQILVTSGAQHAIGLLLTALLSPGDRIVTEHPTYPNALLAMSRRGARAVPLPVGPGWDPGLLAAAVRDAAGLPGAGLPEPDRRADGPRHPRRRRRPGPADQDPAAGRRDPVRARPGRAGTGPAGSPRGRDLAAGLQRRLGEQVLVGWAEGGLDIRTAAAEVRRLAALRPAVDLGTSVLDQLVSTRLIRSIGTADDPLVARRDAVRAARDTLLGEIARRFPTWRTTSPPGGLSLWIDLGTPVSGLLTAAAGRRGVALAAGPRFGLDGAFERWLRVPYTLPSDPMADALDRLATAWRELDPASGVTEPVAVA